MSELRFELKGGGQVLFTRRTDGNLSSIRGAGAEAGHDARERLREAIGVRQLHRGYQVHGTRVRRVLADTPATDQPHAGIDDADGHASSVPGLGMMVLTADCLPVAIGSRRAVAMVHAGWRGLAGGALEEGVRAVLELGGREEAEAIIGPGAGACCYEVGPEVHAALAGSAAWGLSAALAGPAALAGSAALGAPAPAGGSAAPSGSGTGSRPIDLRAIARERLLAAGVARVRDVAACTICDERFFSHRREGARAGRQAGVAWLS